VGPLLSARLVLDLQPCHGTLGLGRKVWARIPNDSALRADKENMMATGIAETETESRPEPQLPPEENPTGEISDHETPARETRPWKSNYWTEPKEQTSRLDEVVVYVVRVVIAAIALAAVSLAIGHLMDDSVTIRRSMRFQVVNEEGLSVPLAGSEVTIQSDSGSSTAISDREGVVHWEQLFDDSVEEVWATILGSDIDCTTYARIERAGPQTEVLITPGSTDTDCEQTGPTSALQAPPVVIKSSQGLQQGESFIEVALGGFASGGDFDIERDGIIVGRTSERTFVDAGPFEVGQVVRYRTRSVSAQPASEWSPTTEVVFSPPAALDVPTDLALLNNGLAPNGQPFVSLTWSVPEGVQAVEIERDGVLVSVDHDLAFRDTNEFVVGQSVSYRIRSKTGDQVSEWTLPLRVVVGEMT